MRILGIETSCDETAIAIIHRQKEDAIIPQTIIKPKEVYLKNKSQYTILANIIYSQIKEHAPFGGVVPEIAARAHVAFVDSLIEEACEQAKCHLQDIDLIAVTQGPGLAGGLIVGIMTAKALSLALNKPFIGVNHLEGHALTARLSNDVAFPYLLLLVSGGHTQIIAVEALGKYKRLGTTLDDALGEAFDKTAKLLNLPYPGGPEVEKAARLGDPLAVPLPRPLKGEKCLDFSFSGLKTAIRQAALKMAPLTQNDIYDLCASFQFAVLETLEDRLIRAFEQFKKLYPKEKTHRFVISGGVGANEKIREMLQELCKTHQFTFSAPPASLCTDNAAMIAFAGAERFLQGEKSDLNIAAKSRWPLDENIKPRIGSGKRGAKA